MRCAGCGKTVVGVVHLWRGRYLCPECYDKLQRAGWFGRLRRWLHILRQPRRVIYAGDD